ncbi:MAG: hypothetical protein P8P42_03225 [Gammaproteobacteria bacterium]|nr:hypothetical protein [Gammaproteobacteria bacterium]MDG1952465.1 hypothetical protein [Gammaproteobacteria bacterium]MDG2117953.1 hypothetical protein [Gammaproteobacteria bacterium]
MPAMTMLGWFHTVLGVLAVLSGFYILFKYQFISLKNLVGKVYILITFLVAASALAIYNQGGFGIAHVLGVLTLFALFGGMIIEKTELFGSLSKYIQALAYTSTLLFHMIPAITDFLRRLPIGDPFINSFEDPLLSNFLSAFLILYILFYGLQVFWLKGKTSPPI